MAKKRKLTWVASVSRWKKKYRGQQYYFPAPEGKTASYARCYREWLGLKTKIDSERESSSEIAVRRSWSPAIDAVREAQQDIIDLYGDSDETREVWVTPFWAPSDSIVATRREAAVCG